MHRLGFASFVRRWAWIAGLSTLAVGAGCGGGQTGGESPIPASGGCDRALRAFALDEQTPLGASPNRVLEAVLGTSTSALLWSSNTGSLTIGPEHGLSEIELTATYSGGRVTWVHFVPPAYETGDTATTLLGCPADRLEIELDVRLRTSGGALDERFVGTLAATSVDNAQLAINLPISGLAGSFFVTAPAGVNADIMQITAVWDVFGFRGTLVGGVEMTDGARDAGSKGGSVGFGFVPFAEWPPPAGSSQP